MFSKIKKKDMATEKEKSTIKEIKRFIRMNEMRYLVHASCDSVYVRKAFKVALNDADHWVYFRYGTSPEVATPTEVKKRLFATMEEAKAKAEEMRAAIKERKAKEAERKKAKINEVTDFLNRLSVWEMENRNDRDIKDEYKALVERIVELYGCLRYIQRRDISEYVELLENYIRTGSICSQALSFPKSQIASVKYGKEGSVEVCLTNGMRITPKNKNVARLIKVVMGSSGGWEYNSIMYPEGDHDKVVEK